MSDGYINHNHLGGMDLSTSVKHSKDEHHLISDIQEIYDKICQAFSNQDIDAALSYFADNNMVKISNGHVLHGKEQLAKHWNQRFGQGNALKITIDNVEVHGIDDKHVWSTADEDISIDGQSQKAVVSNIFILTSLGWKILLDHTTYL